MISKHGNEKLRLTDFQREFIEKVSGEFAPGRVYILIAPAGSGKSHAAAELIHRLATESRVERALVLAPRPMMAQQWAYVMSNRKFPSSEIDAPTYRLLREATGGEGAMPAGVYSMSIDLAKREDVRDYLARTPWDLIVVDEGHMVSGKRELLLTSLRALGEPAVVIITATPTPMIWEVAKLGTIVDWRDSVVAALRGAAAFVNTEVVEYSRTSAEGALLERVTKIAAQIGGLLGSTLLRRASSSVSALELTLNRIVGRQDLTPDQKQELKEILDQLEELSVDTHLATAMNLLSSRAWKHAVLFCEFLDTANYLAASVTEAGFSCWRLNGAMAPEERVAAFDEFQASRGVLISTSVGAAPLSLGFVDTVIHYDLPPRTAEFGQREVLYSRLSRTAPCVAYLLLDVADVLPMAESLRVLQKAGAPRASPELLVSDGDAAIEDDQ